MTTNAATTNEVKTPERDVMDYVIHINSKDCVKLNGSNTNHIRMSMPPLGGNQYDIYIQLLTATIPFSFYAISDLYRNLSIREALTSDPNDYVDVNLSIDAGNYSITQLQSALQSALNSATQKSVNYILTYNRITNKLTFSTDTADRTITLLFDTGALLATDLQDVIGFNRADYTFSTTSSLTSVKPCNVSPTSNIYVMAPNLSITSQINSKFNNYSTILNKIPITALPNNFIFYENDLFVRYLSGLKFLDTIELKLVDEDGDYIDIQGVNWYCSIKVSLVPSNKSNLIEFLKDELIPVGVID